MTTPRERLGLARLRHKEPVAATPVPLPPAPAAPGIFCRLAAEADRAGIIELAQMHPAEVTPWLTFDVDRCNATISRGLLGTPYLTIFVAEDADGLVGYLVASRTDYAACTGFYIQQDLFFVRPDKRGTRAAAKLFAGFVRWAERLKPEEIFAGASWGRRSAAAARWFQRFGFEPAGQQLLRRRVGGQTNVE